MRTEPTSARELAVLLDYPSREHPVETLAPEAVGRGLTACRETEAPTIHCPPDRGSEVVDRFGNMPGFDALNGPAGSQLGTGPGSVPLALGPVSYPVGIIAGTKSINWILSTALPNPDDKVSVERTHVEGMADLVEVPA